jgi:cell division protein FtsN
MHSGEHGDEGHEWVDHDHATHSPSLDLGEEERLPWLESADDIEAGGEGTGQHRLLGFAAAAVALLALLVGGVYWATHRGTHDKPADGSLIEAAKGPYKVAPSDPGGKQFAGTGDASFKVSQGQHPDASLNGSTGTTPPPATPAPSAAASPSAEPAPAPKPAAPAPSGSGVAVQVGAYSSGARAETEWSRLSAAHDMLKGLGHRVVEGKADIGTVYRLQALASDASAANSLCSRLQADGVKCQVKR